MGFLKRWFRILQFLRGQLADLFKKYLLKAVVYQKTLSTRSINSN